MDEVVSLLPLQICHGHWIETERSITWFASSLEGDESTDLFFDMDITWRQDAGNRIFALYQEGEVWWQWWWVVLPCDCRHSLVSPPCSPYPKHGIFACVVAIFPYLVDIWVVLGSLIGIWFFFKLFMDTLIEGLRWLTKRGASSQLHRKLLAFSLVDFYTNFRPRTKKSGICITVQVHISNM